jgi:large subunit ribosomal protein L15
MNLSEVEQFLPSISKNGFAEEKGGKWTVDLTKMGVDKLLGSGRISTPLTIKVAEASATAQEKLKEAGGNLIKE